MANYSMGKKLPIVKAGDTLIEHNFMQQFVYTEIFKGVEDLTFVSCNLLNCKVPKSAVVKDCLTVQKNMCSNLHPEWDWETPCGVVCTHVVDIDTITVDSEVVDTIFHYEDTIV